MKGKVKWYDEVKGFGFIMAEEGTDVFVHRSGLKDSYGGLDTDLDVEFDIQDGAKGPVAVNVAAL